MIGSKKKGVKYNPQLLHNIAPGKFLKKVFTAEVIVLVSHSIASSRFN